MFVRVTAADTDNNGFPDVPAFTVQADPTGNPMRDLTDKCRYVKLVLPVGSPPELSAELGIGNLGATDPLREAYEAILDVIKDLENQVGA